MDYALRLPYLNLAPSQACTNHTLRSIKEACQGLVEVDIACSFMVVLLICLIALSINLNDM
jgi:hypothetical protein